MSSVTTEIKRKHFIAKRCILQDFVAGRIEQTREVDNALISIFVERSLNNIRINLKNYLSQVCHPSKPLANIDDTTSEPPSDKICVNTRDVFYEALRRTTPKTTVKVQPATDPFVRFSLVPTAKHSQLIVVNPDVLFDTENANLFHPIRIVNASIEGAYQHGEYVLLFGWDVESFVPGLFWNFSLESLMYPFDDMEHMLGAWTSPPNMSHLYHEISSAWVFFNFFVDNVDRFIKAHGQLIHSAPDEYKFTSNAIFNVFKMFVNKIHNLVLSSLELDKNFSYVEVDTSAYDNQYEYLDIHRDGMQYCAYTAIMCIATTYNPIKLNNKTIYAKEFTMYLIPSHVRFSITGGPGKFILAKVDKINTSCVARNFDYDILPMMENVGGCSAVFDRMFDSNLTKVFGKINHNLQQMHHLNNFNNQDFCLLLYCSTEVRMRTTKYAPNKAKSHYLVTFAKSAKHYYFALKQPGKFEENEQNTLLRIIYSDLQPKNIQSRINWAYKLAHGNTCIDIGSALDSDVGDVDYRTTVYSKPLSSLTIDELDHHDGMALEMWDYNSIYHKFHHVADNLVHLETLFGGTPTQMMDKLLSPRFLTSIYPSRTTSDVPAIGLVNNLTLDGDFGQRDCNGWSQLMTHVEFKRCPLTNKYLALENMKFLGKNNEYISIAVNDVRNNTLEIENYWADATCYEMYPEYQRLS